MVHHWPDNIREPESASECTFILCEGELIEIAHLPEELASHYAKPVAESCVPSTRLRKNKPWGSSNSLLAARKDAARGSEAPSLDESKPRNLRMHSF